MLDVGGGPGTHARHLADGGYAVSLIDPVARHAKTAQARGAVSPPFAVRLGDARALPVVDASVDAVVLLGPLYHLVDPGDRAAALAEARRVLRPGGRLLAEAIGRHAWVMDATAKDLLDRPGLLDDVERTVRTGLSQDPDDVPDGGFWAYFHRPGELAEELADAGFAGIELVAVETEPSMLGCSAHVIGVAMRP